MNMQDPNESQKVDDIEDITIFIPIADTKFSDIDTFIESALAEQGLSAEQYALVPLNDVEYRKSIISDLFDIHMIDRVEDNSWIVHLRDNDGEIPCHLRVLRKLELH